jgi:hypothetical protein
MPPASFSVAIVTWQNFYLLVGTAAATLIGLMFVAVTFGSTLVTKDASGSVRAFLDPTFTHFVQVLLTACLIVIPTIGPTLLGAVLSFVTLLRTAALLRVYRHMREAHRVHQDIELSDWLMGILVPLLSYLLLGTTGAAFFAGYSIAFNLLAVVTIAILLNGVYGAWELMVWLALTRARRSAPGEQG